MEAIVSRANSGLMSAAIITSGTIKGAGEPSVTGTIEDPTCQSRVIFFLIRVGVKHDAGGPWRSLQRLYENVPAAGRQGEN
jgi:hypothetical protein